MQKPSPKRLVNKACVFFLLHIDRRRIASLLISDLTMIFRTFEAPTHSLSNVSRRYVSADIFIRNRTHFLPILFFYLSPLPVRSQLSKQLPQLPADGRHPRIVPSFITVSQSRNASPQEGRTVDPPSLQVQRKDACLDARAAKYGASRKKVAAKPGKASVAH